MQAELIVIFISTLILIRFWKTALFLFLCALVSLTLLGMIAAVGLLAH